MNLKFLSDEFGGRRVSYLMKPFLHHLHMTCVPYEVNIGTVTEALDEHGRPLKVNLIPEMEKLICQVRTPLRTITSEKKL